MLTLNGKVLPYDKEFRIDGVLYPASWLRRASSQEKKNIGIEEVPAPPWYDRRFYTAVDQPKDHKMLQVKYTAETKDKTGAALAETDWQVIRKADDSSGHQPMDPAVVTLRAEIRARSDEMELAIASTQTTEELAAFINSEAYTSWFPQSQ